MNPAMSSTSWQLVQKELSPQKKNEVEESWYIHIVQNERACLGVATEPAVELLFRRQLRKQTNMLPGSPDCIIILTSNHET